MPQHAQFASLYHSTRIAHILECHHRAVGAVPVERIALLLVHIHLHRIATCGRTVIGHHHEVHRLAQVHTVLAVVGLPLGCGIIGRTIHHSGSIEADGHQQCTQVGIKEQRIAVFDGLRTLVDGHLERAARIGSLVSHGLAQAVGSPVPALDVAQGYVLDVTIIIQGHLIILEARCKQPA